MAKKDDAMVPVTQGDGSLPGVSMATPESMDDLLRNARIMPQVLSLIEGQQVEGVLHGKGAQLECRQPDGNMGAVDTWNVELSNGVVVALMSSHYLDKNLPELVGHRIVVMRGKQKDIGTRRVNTFIVADKGKVYDAKTGEVPG